MKHLFFVFALLLGFSLTGTTQQILDLQAIPKLGNTRLVARLDNDQIWWFADGKEWQKVPSTGLPSGSSIHLFDSYLKLSLSDNSSRLVAVLNDNTCWWYKDGENWEKISEEGLPEGKIRIFRAYLKMGAMGGSESRFIAVMEDNTIWWFSPGSKWKSVTSGGLTSGKAIVHLGTYQKKEMMGFETRYVITLEDNSIWWYSGGKKWQQIKKTEGLPANYEIAHFDTYMKMGSALIGGGIGDGRLITVLADQSIWWHAVSGKSWKKLETTGLPASYKVRSLRIYQKYPGLGGGDTRVIIVLENNSCWWYDEDKGWSELDTKKLMVS